MRLIPTHRAVDGSELGRDVVIGRADGAPLLRSGVRLTERYRDLLLSAGVGAVYVEDEQSAGIVVEPIVDDATREVATRAVASAYRSAKDAMTAGKPLPFEAIDSLGDTSPSWQVMGLAAVSQEPWSWLTDSTSTPAGSASLRTTLRAVEGPWFVTTIL